MNTTSTSSSRRYDLDWLRVLLILTVLVFHSIHFFDTGGWHVKNAATYLGPDIAMTFISRWMMPAIFIISGAATFYALKKRSAGQFLKDRALRLLVPLLAGLFTHIPLQGYLEVKTQYGFTGSFWDFYAGMFNGLDWFGGRFNWTGNHLWYLEMLFLFSLILLPLLIWLRRGSGQRVLGWLGNLLSSPATIYLIVLPFLLLAYLIDPNDGGFFSNMDSFGGWNLPNHLLFFLFGFLLASSSGMQAAIRKTRWFSLIAGILTFAAGGTLYIIYGDLPFGTPMFLVLISFSVLIGWTWILAIFGFSLERLNFHTPLLDYAGEAVMPFYVMHQTVLVVVGYFVVGWAVPDLLKWVIILVSTFAIIMALYEFMVRRINLLRVLFGMKPLRREALVQKPAAQVS